MKVRSLGGIVVLSVFLLVTFCTCAPRDYSEWICFHCRCRHTTGEIMGVSYETYGPTAITTWYREQFPSHIHQWLHLGHSRGNLLGQRESSVGGRLRTMNPIWVISEGEQFEYLKAANAVETYQFTSFLANHDQRNAANLVLRKQKTPRILCDNYRGFEGCYGKVIPLDEAIKGGTPEAPLWFCSQACKSLYRER